MYGACLDALELRKDSEQTFLNVGSGSNYLSAVVGCILGERGVIHNVELEEDVMRFGKEKVRKLKVLETCIFFLTTCLTFSLP